MGLADKFPRGGWAEVQSQAPANTGKLDWSLVAGQVFMVIDNDVEKEMVLLRTYEIVGQNYWFFAETLIPSKEPARVYLNRIFEEDMRIAEFQKNLQDKYMREVFGR